MWTTPACSACGPASTPADTVLDFFTYAGAPGAYDLDGLGGGFGATYNNVLGFDGVTLSSNYVSINANKGTDGLMTDTSSSVSVTQLGYTGGKFPVIGGSAWGAAAATPTARTTACSSPPRLGWSTAPPAPPTVSA